MIDATNTDTAREREHCSRCGGDDLARDEVWDSGALALWECRRCTQRWTEAAVGAPRRADSGAGRIEALPEPKRVAA